MIKKQPLCYHDQEERNMIFKMKKTFFLLCFLLPAFVFAQKDSLVSGVYVWKEPVSRGLTPSSAILFEGKVHDMEWLQMSANTLRESKVKIDLKVPGNEEYLLIIQSGKLDIVVNNAIQSIGAGSIALLLPGENFSLQNRGTRPCSYYVMKYRSKQPVDAERGRPNGGSLVIDWNKTVFKPHNKGGRRDFFERATAMCKRMEMHVSILKQGLKSHDPHTHRAEEIVLVTEGETEMQIGDKLYKGKRDSIYYLGSNVSHAIKNVGTVPCTYFAFQFE